MTSPEQSGEYAPDQAELHLIYTGIRRALETNPQFRVRIKKTHVGSMHSTVRRCVIGGLAAKEILGPLHQEYDEIAIQSRTVESTAIGPEWVTVELQQHDDPQRDRHSLQYSLGEKLNFSQSKREPPIYDISKRLPQLEGPPPENTVGRVYTREDREYDFFLERQVRAIVPYDMELLQRLRQSLQE